MTWPTEIKWARLHYAGEYHRWHIVNGVEAVCGRQRFDNDRAQYSDLPASGKLCKLCTAEQKGRMEVRNLIAEIRRNHGG